ncbi:MAG: histidinol-phosphate transaminase [Acidiferrobacter sp.]
MTCDPLVLAVPGVRTLVPYEPGKPIAELERELGLTDIIKLASNENPYGPSDAVRAAVGAVLGELARYPDGAGFVLKRALADHLGVETSQIVLGNGSNDVLELVARTFVGPGEIALCDQYAFAVYPITVRGLGAQMRVIPARHFAHDLEAMADALTPAVRMVFLANPNNPTGTWFDRDALQGFLARCPVTTLVVLDEAYYEYVNEPGYPDGCAFLADHQNLVIVRTFSKVYGLAGLRVGYGITAAPIASLMNRLRQPFNVSLVAQAAAIAALGDQAYVAKMTALNRDGREGLRQALVGLGLPVLPSAGNFLCVEVGDAGRVYQALLRRGVIVRPLGPYGMPHHLRMTVGRPEENERLMTALQAVMRGRL